MIDPRIISLDELVGIDDLPEEVLAIPEWDGLAVRIRGMTKQQEMEVRREATAGGEWDADVWELALITRCVVEPALTPEHAALIRGKSAGAIDRILRRVLALSGLGKGVAEAAKAEFPAAPGDDVRIPPGEGSGDDGAPPAAGDAGPGDDAVGGLVLGGGGAGEAGSEEG